MQVWSLTSHSRQCTLCSTEPHSLQTAINAAVTSNTGNKYTLMWLICKVLEAVGHSLGKIIFSRKRVFYV